MRRAIAVDAPNSRANSRRPHAIARSLEYALQLLQRAIDAGRRNATIVASTSARHVSGSMAETVDAAFDVQSSCAARRRDEVFLMNTLTDAQLVVSPDVAALLDRAATSIGTTLDDEEREALDLLARERLPRRRAATPIARRSTSYFDRGQERHVGAARHGADDAAVQLRLRLLLPGRSRRLQQVRREDVARDGGARRRLDRARARPRAAREARRSRSSAASRCSTCR